MHRRGGLLVTVALAALAAAPATADAAAGTPVDPHSPQALAVTVHDLRGCLPLISASDRQLLLTRFGTGGKPLRTRQAAATLLNTTVAALQTRELAAVRHLAAARRRGACRSQPGPAHHVAKSAPAPASTPATAVSTPTPRTPAAKPVSSNSGGLSKPVAVIGLVVIALCVLVILREFRHVLFPRAFRED